MMMRQDGSGISQSSSSSSSRCQDCGNQAKKDCSFLRCRTCCKSRGFHCQTHVNSTWVPLSKRRPRHLHQQQQISSSSTINPPHQQQLQLPQEEPNPKRSRDFITPSLGLIEGNNFPAEIRFPAVFRCVRVSSMDNVVDQLAYQTSVNIGGHIFKGVLYDQGPAADTTQYIAGETSSSGGGGGGFLQQQPNLITTTTTNITSAASPSSNYQPSPFSANFMPPAGTQFFQYPKS